MAAEENKAVVRRFYDEVLNEGKIDVLDEIIAPDGRDHSAPPGMPSGREGVRQTVKMFLTAFPDLHYSIEEMIAEGDKVVVRGTWTGTHRGEMLGMPPTGRQVRVPAIEISRVAGGQFVEHWSVFDQLGMLQQLGVIPAPEQSPA